MFALTLGYIQYRDDRLPLNLDRDLPVTPFDPLSGYPETPPSCLC